jgi:Tol biopolymer transport system component
MRTSAFVVALPDSAKLIQAAGGIRIALSHDGSQLAYVGMQNGKSIIYIRSLDDTVPRVLRGTEGAGNPAFSPDGAWLVFSQSGSVKKVSSAGGSAAVVSDSAGGIADWSDRNEILFARSGAIWRVSPEGGPPLLVARPDSSHGYTSFTAPHALPGGRAAFITMYRAAMVKRWQARHRQYS